MHVSKMKTMDARNGIWQNKEEMKQYPLLSVAMEKMLAHFDLSNVNKVHQYEWHIKNDEYQRLLDCAPEKYIDCAATYVLNGEVIDFQIRCYAKYSAKVPEVAIFLSFDELPGIMKRVRIEADIKCIKKQPFRRLMREQIVSKQRSFGFRCFPSEKLRANDGMTWLIAPKMFRAERARVDTEVEKHNSEHKSSYEPDDDTTISISSSSVSHQQQGARSRWRK